MYNDTLKVENKIITNENLYDIFSNMNEKLKYYKKIYQEEEQKNHILENRYREWTFEDSNSDLKFEVDFYDNTQISFDNYDNFMSVFNNRLQEIKRIWVYFRLNYSVKKEEEESKFIMEHINMIITEGKIDIDVSLPSEGSKAQNIYELIKNYILQAPEKYDFIVKKRTSIMNRVGSSIAFIPAIIVCLLTFIVADMRETYSQTYVLFPVILTLITFLLGGVIGSAMLGSYYDTLKPEKKYAGWDNFSDKSVYTDDVDSYKETSEIEIGANYKNTEKREHIKNTYRKYKSWLIPEIFIGVIFSIIAIFIGKI